MKNLDFTNRNLRELFEIGGTKFYLTDTLVSMFVIMAILIAFAIVVRIKLKHFKEVPTGFQNVVEFMVETMHKFTITTMGKEYENFGGFFFGMFLFIIASNYIGLLGLRSPTADVATTLALSLSIFLITHIVGIYRQRGAYLKSFIEPNVVFLPINLIGEVSNVLSLCFRLFGNALGGLIIMGLLFGMLPYWASFFLPVPLSAYFDIFSGALQAYIFTILSMTFIKQKGSQN